MNDRTEPHVTVSLNGERRTLPVGSTLAGAVAAIVPAGGTTGRGMAAALNENVVPRAAWERTPLGDGDRVEVLTAVQGG
ncbi:sulfur carrier protein ThiS [Streptomyces calidiresistens]|uniref:Sulfur carrier protein ThiS n=1 Tax=Streptomyces calidiresistens TaxID=1485586 RepID=A0A7W3XYA1_9ACTN|nr:sulfur carrier protein ThiS [Streptomyces calidiresistens]MBB0231728.1 sulfur carrier protein ThiS [Streptomyces calidiresistens]